MAGLSDCPLPVPPVCGIFVKDLGEYLPSPIMQLCFKGNFIIIVEDGNQDTGVVEVLTFPFFFHMTLHEC